MIQKEFIRNELRYRFPDLHDSIRHPEQPVGRPLLLERGIRQYGARIVICFGAELSTAFLQPSSDPLFLCIGTPDSTLLDTLDICILPEGEQSGAVLNFIQRLFDRLDDWTQRLRQAAEAGEGIEMLLSRAGDLLQNPVVLLDERGHVVAQSEQTELAIITQELSSDILSEPDKRVIKSAHGTSPEALTVSLQGRDARYTLLCTASERLLYASDEIVLESLAGFLRLMLSERSINQNKNRSQRELAAIETAFRSLLSQDENASAALRVLQEHGWNEADEFTILAVEPQNKDLRASKAESLCDLLEQELDACAFLFSSVIVTIMKTELLQSDSFIGKIRSIGGEHLVNVGICETFPGFTLLPERLHQAKLALNHAPEFGGIALFSDVFELEYPFNTSLDLPAELLCMRPVLALARYDRAHATNYLDTAEAYVNNRFNAVKTAGELFIHRSTFLYRLERIKSQFGLDLDDRNNSMLHLLLSLKIAKRL